MFRIQKIIKWSSTGSKPIKNEKALSSQPKSKGKRKFKRMALMGLTVFLSLMIYSKTRKNEIQFLMLNSELNRLFIKNNKQLNKQLFLPTLYLPLGLLQMVWAKYFQSRRYIKHTKENLDGYTVYYMPKSIAQEKIEEQNFRNSKSNNNQIKSGGKIDCVIVVGGSQGFNELMTNIMVLAHSNKFEVVGLEVDDLHKEDKLIKIVNKIKQKRNNQKVFGVGIEYGANLLTLACTREPHLFDGLVSLGNPFDLAKAEKQVEQSYSAKWTFLSNMREGRIKKSPKSITPAISPSTPFSALSNVLYSLNPSSIPQFYNQHSSINCLSALKIPSLFLNSKQDPFSIQFQQNEQFQNNPLLMFVLTKHGGHNEWFYSLTPTRWAARLTVSHLKNLNKILKENPGIVEAELHTFQKQQQKEKGKNNDENQFRE